MSLSTALLVFGILLIVGPGLLAFLEGCSADKDDDADLIHWMMGKDLHQIFTMQGMVHGGLLVITVALAVGWCGA